VNPTHRRIGWGGVAVAACVALSAPALAGAPKVAQNFPFHSAPAAPASTDPLRDGQKAYLRGDFSAAMQLLRPLAEQGSADAQAYLGLMYDNGQGVSRDYAEAARWYRKGAEGGNVTAQSLLAGMYTEGRGVSKDDAETVKWLLKAAEQGSATAQRLMAFRYMEGRGVPRDEERSAEWFFRAAGHGDAEAQFNLGQIHAEGRGVPRDPVQAYLWFSLAAGNGADAQAGRLAVEARNKLAPRMTPAQIAQAKRLVREWKPEKDH